MRFPTPIRGVIPAITTPFTHNGTLDTGSLKQNILKWNRFDLTGYLALGSTGEYVMLNRSEKIAVMEAVRDAAPAHKLLLAGTGAQSTQETIELTNIAAQIGFDAALVITPYYFKNVMTTRALKQHYHSVADQSPIPVLIYNMPAATGLDLTAEQILEISQHPNIMGVKDSGTNVIKLAQIAAGCKKRFSLLTGSASMMLPAFSVGATGAILALANIAPKQCVNLYKSFSQGELSKSRIIQHKLIPVNFAVTTQWGIPALKYSMDLLGWKGGAAKLPLLPVQQEFKNELRKILNSAGIKK